MRVKCIRTFRDFDAGRIRDNGEEFDVSPARFESINGTRYGTLVEALREPETDENPEVDKTAESAPEVAQKRPQRRKTAKQQ